MIDAFFMTVIVAGCSLWADRGKSLGGDELERALKTADCVVETIACVEARNPDEKTFQEQFDQCRAPYLSEQGNK